MKRLFITLVCLSLCVPSFAANEWQSGSASYMDGDSVLFNDIDTNLNNYYAEPLERILVNYRKGMKISYTDASTLSIAAGSIVCSNSAGTIRKMRTNTSATAVTFTNIDTGSEEASTTYYVYANCTADATTATFTLSKSASTPDAAITSYRKLGSFFNNSSSAILNDETITNDDNYYALQFGDWTSKSNATSYLASTDGTVTAISSSAITSINGYTDSSNPPTTARIWDESTTSDGSCGLTMPVKKGDYYKVTGADTVYWLPSQ